MEASRLYYGFDIAPGFWSWLEKPSLAGQLVTWAKGLPPEFWLQETDDTVAVMSNLSAWAADPSRPYS